MASQPAVAPSCRAGFASASQFLPSISCSSLCFAGSSSLTLALEESPLTLRVSNLCGLVFFFLNTSCGIEMRTEMGSRQGYNPLRHASQRAGNFESQGQAISGYPWLLSSSETCLSGPRRGQSHPFLPVSASLPTPGDRGAITHASVSF